MTDAYDEPSADLPEEDDELEDYWDDSLSCGCCACCGCTCSDWDDWDEDYEDFDDDELDD